MSQVKQRLLSAIEQAPDVQLEKLLVILESWKIDGMIEFEKEANHSGIQETQYLLSIPGMRESILDGIATPIQDCNRELEW